MKIVLYFYGLCGKRRDTELRHFLPNAPQFGDHATFSRQKVKVSQSGKRHCNPRIAALYKTAHCGVAIKVPALLAGESSVNAAMFSSAAAARLLH